jgi:hypothetical protein
MYNGFLKILANNCSKTVKKVAKNKITTIKTKNNSTKAKKISILKNCDLGSVDFVFPKGSWALKIKQP